MMIIINKEGISPLSYTKFYMNLGAPVLAAPDRIFVNTAFYTIFQAVCCTKRQENFSRKPIDFSIDSCYNNTRVKEGGTQDVLEKEKAGFLESL